MKWTHTAPAPKPEDELASHRRSGPPQSSDPSTPEPGDPPEAQATANAPDEVKAAPDRAAAPEPSPGSCHVNLTADEIRTRLLEACDTTFLSRLINLVGFSFARKSYVGHIGRRRFRVETRNGFGSHGGALVLYGSLQPLDNGTHIRWRFGLHPFLRLAAGIWFLAAAVVFVVNLLRALFTHGVSWGFRAGHLLMAVVGPSLMVIAGLAFIRYSLYSERAKKQTLTELLLRMCRED